ADDGEHGLEPWTVTVVPPAASIGPASPNPRNTTVPSIPITFTETVSGFDLSDLTLTHNGLSVSLAGAALTSNDNIHWTLANFSGMTAAEGTYVLTLTAAGSGIMDADRIAMAADATTTWVMDTTPPTASVAAVSPNPRNSASAAVTIAFSEPV